MAKRERIAFLGLGIMGAPMAANVARAGFEVIAWNRTAARAEEFAAEHEGARHAPSPAEASAEADVTITMVPDSPEVEAVLLGDGGAAEGMREGHLAIDMSTIAPTRERRDRRAPPRAGHRLSRRAGDAARARRRRTAR